MTDTLERPATTPVVLIGGFLLVPFSVLLGLID